MGEPELKEYFRKCYFIYAFDDEGKDTDKLEEIEIIFKSLFSIPNGVYSKITKEVIGEEDEKEKKSREEYLEYIESLSDEEKLVQRHIEEMDDGEENDVWGDLFWELRTHDIEAFKEIINFRKVPIKMVKEVVSEGMRILISEGAIGTINEIGKIVETPKEEFDKIVESEILEDLNQKERPGAKVFFIARLFSVPDEKLNNLISNFITGKLSSGQLEEIILLDQTLGTAISNLSAKENYYFLKFARTNTIELTRLKKFAQEFGEKGMKSFLSLENDKSLGEGIISMSEEIEKIASISIFDKYSNIVDGSDKIADFMIENFNKGFIERNIPGLLKDGGKEGNLEIINAISTKVLEKSQEFIKKFVTKVVVAKREGKNQTEEEKTAFSSEIIDELKNIKEEISVFSATLRTIREMNIQISFETLLKADFNSIKPQKISGEDRKKMEAMYRKNYEKQPNLREKLIEGFLLSLENKGNTFYCFRYNKELEGFYRLEERTDGSLYFGAFNVSVPLAGSNIGEMMMKEVLDIKAKDRIIEADCDLASSISSNYLERGFIATNQYQFEEANAIKIFRNDGGNKAFISKKMNREEIISKSKIGETITSADGNLLFMSQEVGSMEKLTFGLVNKTENGFKYVLTRYLRERNAENKKNEKIYLVFERVSKEFLDKYTNFKQI